MHLIHWHHTLQPLESSRGSWAAEMRSKWGINKLLGETLYHFQVSRSRALKPCGLRLCLVFFLFSFFFYFFPWAILNHSFPRGRGICNIHICIYLLFSDLHLFVALSIKIDFFPLFSPFFLFLSLFLLFSSFSMKFLVFHPVVVGRRHRLYWNTPMCHESISFRQFLNFDNRPRRSKVIDNNVELMKLLSLSKNM